MKAWLFCTLAILSSLGCVEPAYQRCVQSGHCRASVEMDSGIDAGPDITTGLIGHWKLDGTNASEVEDFSGFGHHGQVEGVTRWVPGKIGKAMDVDGRGGVVIKSTSQISDLQLMTFATWLNVRDFPNAGDAGSPQPRIMDKNAIALAVCVHPSCNRTLAYGNQTTNKYGQWKPPNDILPMPDAGALSEHWRHFVVVHDRRRIENDPQFFLDGALTTTEKLELFDGGTFVSDQGEPLALGYRVNSPARSLNGQLDDVRLYNRLLSPSEVEALFRLAQ